jgi:hypothetical protein
MLWLLIDFLLFDNFFYLEQNYSLWNKIFSMPFLNPSALSTKGLTSMRTHSLSLSLAQVILAVNNNNDLLKNHSTIT